MVSFGENLIGELLGSMVNLNGTFFFLTLCFKNVRFGEVSGMW